MKSQGFKIVGAPCVMGEDLMQERAKVPPPPCNSHALVQATVGVGTVLIWYLILIRYQM